MKIIRDRVLVNDGGVEGPQVSGFHYRQLIIAKLVEEALEAQDAFAAAFSTEALGAVSEELADLEETLRAAARVMPGGRRRVARLRRRKRRERGGFRWGRTYERRPA